MNIATKIAALIAPLNESARAVVYTIQGTDQQYTFTAPDAAAAASMMLELHSMAGFQPVAAAYADAPGAPSPSVPKFAHDLEAREVRIGFTGGM